MSSSSSNTGRPRGGSSRDGTTSSTSNIRGTSETYSLNRRHRSGSITSFHFHPERDGSGLHATDLSARQMGHIQHYSATNNTLTQHNSDSTDHRWVSSVNQHHGFSSDTFRSSNGGGEAGAAFSAANQRTHADLDAEMDDYHNQSD